MTSIDLRDPHIQRNPYPLYVEMRRQPKLARIKGVFGDDNKIFVTRYEDILRILKDPRCINDASKIPTLDYWGVKWYVPKVVKSLLNTMVTLDEPDHTRLRQLVHKAFTPTMITQYVSKIEGLAHQLLDEASKRQTVDFMTDYALPLPLTMIGDMVGISPKDRKLFAQAMKGNLVGATPDEGLRMIPKLIDAARLHALLKRLIADHRKHPHNDMLGILVAAEEAGDKLSEDELMGMLFAILFAGHDTTVNLLGNGLLALLQHPDQFEKLKANPNLMDSAIEELLRYTNPVQQVAQRYTLEDMEISGEIVPKYTAIYLGVAAGNRDETVFENPDQFDITRTPNKHLSFGFGVHYCLGAPLARLEAKIAFNILFSRYPNIRLNAPVDQLKWKGAPFLRGLVSLPIVLE
jgi:cytochrome P450 PksS